MDYAQITNLISTVGFPIVVCGAMFWYMVTENRAMREVIDNNTKVLIELKEHIVGGNE